MKKQLLCLACLLVLFLAVSAPPVAAWNNGGYSTDPYNPKYGTHDYLLEHALNMLPSAERSTIIHNLPLALYGTELPDNGIGDKTKHHVYYRSTGQLQDNASADRAQQEYNLALSYLENGDYDNADEQIGAMSHYITDLAVFAHVMGASTNWGAGVHHESYEDYVQNRTTIYTSPVFDRYIVYDGSLTGMSAYDVAINLAYTITFGSGDVENCTWMDSNYGWSNTTFKDSCGASMDLAVNYLAEVLHQLYLDYSPGTTTTPTTPVTTTTTTTSTSTVPTVTITTTTVPTTTTTTTTVTTASSVPSTSNLLTDGQTNPTNLTDFTPTFSWSYSDPDNYPQTQWQIQVGEFGTPAGLPNMWNPGPASSSNTSTTYAGSALSAGVTYFVQVRTYNGYNWSDWVFGTFEMAGTPWAWIGVGIAIVVVIAVVALVLTRKGK